MNKYKVEKSSDSENSEVDDDEFYEGAKSYKTKRNVNKTDENYDVSDNDKYYNEEILNHPKSKNKTTTESFQRYPDSDVDNDDNLSYIVHAVLEELKAEKSNGKNQKREQDENTVKFAKEIDRYLANDHIKRNKYLASHNEFQRRLKK